MIDALNSADSDLDSSVVLLHIELANILLDLRVFAHSPLHSFDPNLAHCIDFLSQQWSIALLSGSTVSLESQNPSCDSNCPFVREPMH